MKARVTRPARPLLPAATALVVALSVAACHERTADDRTTGASSSASAATPPSATPQPDGSPSIAIVHGDARQTVTSSTLATRPTKLVASNRRAWLVSEIVGADYASSATTVSVTTTEGERHLLRGEGSTRDDRPILVRRSSGELYIGWLAPGDLPLADAEQPADRIEHVASVNIEKTEPTEEETPASITVVANGQTIATLTPADFTKAATLRIRSDRAEPAPAIDVERAFTANKSHLTSGTAAGEEASLSRPRPDARPVVTMNRRKQFKLAWVDANGRLIGDSKVRNLSRLVLSP